MPSCSFNEHFARVRHNKEAEQIFNEESRRLDVAVALMQARESAGLTQERLAEKSGVSRITISRIEQGRISPSFRALDSLASAMGKKLTISFNN
jgi:DNA-binding XRE family transcriptional regulator